MAIDTRNAAFARVRSALRHQSGAAAAIGRFVLEAPFRARKLSIEDLADACGTSAATVCRFCRDLGYEGYKEFQLDLAATLANSDAYELGDLEDSASPETIVRKVFEYHRQGLTDTELILDVQALTKVARLIQRSRRVLLLGFGASGLAARRAADSLLTLGYTAIAIVDAYTQIFATANTGPGDVVVGISHTGQTVAIIEAIQTARRRGARTVALTNYPRSPLVEASEFQLITGFPEHRINAATSSSISAQLSVLSSLYFILGSWGQRKAKHLAEECERRARRILRAPGRREREKSS